MSYTNDGIACGSDWYMYEAMRTEGNDARLLSFGGGRGHDEPLNAAAWIVGCLGVVTSCSSQCETAFAACVSASTQSAGDSKFLDCEDQLKVGSLAACTVGCAPTLGMLRLSEAPVVSSGGAAVGAR